MKREAKSILSLSLLLLLWSSCTTETNSNKNNSNSKQGVAAKPKKKATRIAAAPQEEGILRPFSFTLVGTLGDKQPIEMYLSYKPEDLKKSSHCVDVLGDYAYTDNNTSSFKLAGEFCFDLGIATLHSKKGKQTLKSFKGTFDGQVHSISGKWTNNKTEEQRIFDLKNTCENIDQNTLQLFAQKLHEHLGHSKKCTVDKVGFDEKGIFIKNLSAPNLTVYDFSPTHFKWNTSAESDHKSSDYKETVDLWFYDDDADFVIVISSTNWLEKKEKDGSTNEIETHQTEVWKYNGNTFKNIFVVNADKADLSQASWYAIQTNQMLQLHKNKGAGLWEWNH